MKQYPKNPKIDAINNRFELFDNIDEILVRSTIDVRFLVEDKKALRLDLIHKSSKLEG